MRKKSKYIVISILVVAMLIRYVYILKTDISYFQYDTGIEKLETEEDYDNLYTDFDKGKNEGRHINYIMYLYTYKSLPNEIKGQFYHPPLHHFIMATWLKFLDNFSLKSSTKFESMQYITLVYSIVALIAFYKILKEINLEDKYKIIPLLLYSFLPLNIFLAGSINNDMLVSMFAILTLLYLIKWQKNPTMKNAILISLFIGLGCMTKTSMFIMILPAMYIYFNVLSKSVKENKKVGKLIIQLILVVVIITFLSLWFQVRELMNGLNTLGIIAPREELRVNKSLLERFGLSNILYMNDYNIWNYLIYTTLNFGILLENNWYISFMAVSITILAIESIYFMFKYQKSNILFFITNILWWLGYFYLNIQMPYICSMCARYMFIPISILIIFLGIGLKNSKNKFINYQISILSVVFACMSIVGFIIL